LHPTWIEAKSSNASLCRIGIMAEYKFPDGFEDHIHRIITVRKPEYNVHTPAGINLAMDKHIQELHSILKEEYPGAEYGPMTDVNNGIHYVVVFDSPEDTLSFAMKYGAKYGDKP
jgi:hypothetical protein